MKILAIESASVTASCALAENDFILGEITLNHKKTHSEKLMPLIELLLNELSISIRDINLIAISEGPGSYTGLRIGAAIAKSLAYAVNIPIANIPTMKSLAGNIYDLNNLIVPIMDAKAGRIYTGIYKWDDNELKTVKEQFACTIDELIEILNKNSQSVIFSGDGSVNYRNKLNEGLNIKKGFAAAKFNNLNASTLAYLAHKMALDNKLISAFDFKPQYLRLSQAERNLS